MYYSSIFIFIKKYLISIATLWKAIVSSRGKESYEYILIFAELWEITYENYEKYHVSLPWDI